MKKITKILLCFLLAFTLLTPIVTFATEAVTEISEEPEATAENSVFSRIWEFVQENRSEAISAGGSALLLFFGWVTKVANKKQGKALSDQLTSIKADTGDTAKSQSSVLDVINEMINGYNGMKSGYDDMRVAYELNANKEDDRNRLIGAVMVQNTALLEILASVYVHNSNLPQGVRDLVILKYANVQKALLDDQLLCAIVESVREKVNFEEPVSSEEDAEAAETDCIEETEPLEV